VKRRSFPTPLGQLAMTDNSNLEKRLTDLERRHNKTREALIHAHSLIMVIMANLYFEPKSIIGLIIVCGVR
jgi:hypothetical protein